MEFIETTVFSRRADEFLGPEEARIQRRKRALLAIVRREFG